MAEEELARSVSTAMNLQREETDLTRGIMEVIESLAMLGDYRNTQRKECFSLVRRIKLLVPLLEEIAEIGTVIPYQASNCLCNLKKALVFAMKLLKICHTGSKICHTEVGSLYWKMMFHAVCWGIWCERNRRTFDEEERTLDQVIRDIKKLLWSWGLGEKIGRAVREDEIMFNWQNIISLVV